MRAPPSARDSRPARPPLWSLLIPAFQMPDEIAHYAYAEHVAQTGRPPAERPHPAPRALAGRFGEVARRPENAGAWTRLDLRDLDRAQRAGLSRQSPAYSYGATPQPPLYYALAAIP
jgi:hypothetical protein